MPDDGGLFDQDYKLMRQMSGLSGVYNTVTYATNLKGKEIHRLTDSQRRMIRFLMDEGVW